MTGLRWTRRDQQAGQRREDDQRHHARLQQREIIAGAARSRCATTPDCVPISATLMRHSPCSIAFKAARARSRSAATIAAGRASMIARP